MSTKSKLLDKIDEKAQKIREKRKIAAEPKTIESFVFEFFRRLDEHHHNPVLTEIALLSLEENLRTFDKGCATKIEYNENNQVRGVTIYWSPVYFKLKKIEPSLYIDIGQMLLF